MSVGYSQFVFKAFARLCIIFLFFSLHSCAIQDSSVIEPVGLIPFLYDDGDITSLKQAVHHHEISLKQASHNPSGQNPGKPIGESDLSRSLHAFLEIIETYTQPFARDKAIKEHFELFQARGRSQRKLGEMLVTGYYEPILYGSLVRKSPYIHPLYAPPADLKNHVNESGKTTTGRIDNAGKLSPYWTRAEIETTNVLKGYELVYLKDPFDAFLLHVQGSGKIKLQNGSMRSIQYRANNGHAYTSIGKVLVDEKKMLLKDVDVPAIRQFFIKNPHELTRIIHLNKRYIFFGWGEETHPRGSMGVPLTPQRSIAVDRKSLPMGTIGYLISRKPVINGAGEIISWKTMHRFVLPQDTGAAITGPGRVDFFWGNGNYAEIAAGTMKESGKLYFLVKKKETDGS